MNASPASGEGGGLAAALANRAASVTEGLLRPVNALSGARAQATSLARDEHRPWPPPDAPWLMGQTWRDLLFAHWPVDRRELARVVPNQFEIETFDGKAWIGVTPFRVEALRLRGTAPVPLLSSFPEVNVRTYVSYDGIPGIYFLSLDTPSLPAVWSARRGYRLPYFRSSGSIGPDPQREGSFAFRSERRNGPEASFQAAYRPVGHEHLAPSGSFENWAAEPYCLYTLDDAEDVLRGKIHHRPWAIRDAEASFPVNTMADAFGIELEGEPRLHYAARQDVVLWPNRKAD